MLWNHPSTRREFLASTTLASLACTARGIPSPGLGDSSTRPGTDAGPSGWTLFIGTYTKSGASRGIYRTTVQPDSLAIAEPVLAAACDEPSFLAWGPERRTLVAVNELLEVQGEASGGVSAFAHDGTTHGLRLTGVMQRSRGAAPCYVTVDRSGRHVLVANYVGGNVAVLPMSRDGVLGASAAVIAHAGAGPNRARQQGPHAHCIVLDAEERFAYAADLGSDRVYISHFDAVSGALTPAAIPYVSVAAGGGPRHLALSPDGRWLYCVNELDSTLVAFARDADAGSLALHTVVSTRPAGASGPNAPADLHVHPSGRTIYLSNRGDNTLAVFGTTGAGDLAHLQTVSCGGDWPRNFALTPDGRGLLVAHQRSNSIVAFRIDTDSGTLTPAGQAVSTPVPVCLLFA